MQHSVGYVIGFSAAVCGVCAILVSSSAVTLAERQEVNAALEKQRNVLEAAGLKTRDETLDAAEVAERFQTIQPAVVELETGEEVSGVDPLTFDQQKAKKDPAQSQRAPRNNAGISRLPNRALVYKVMGEGGQVEKLVLPVEGYGLWSTLYGFLALSADTRTIVGLTFYRHGETPGLGGEVDNAAWKALWPGRQAFDENWEPRIEVIKGQAGPVEEAPYWVDGLSGATITSRGVTHLLRFWLGPEGFGPYLENFRQSRRT